MSKNPILEELYAVREKMLAEHGGDLPALLRALADETRNSGHPIANLTPRKINRKTLAPTDGIASPAPSIPVSR